MLIRDANPGDVATLVAYNVAMALESEDRDLSPAVVEPGVAHVIAHPRDGFYLIAERDGEPVGALLVTFEWSEWRNGRFWWIQSVFVAPEARRGGVYSALHAEVRARAQADPEACGIRLYVEKDNTGAQATYHALGMVETDYKLFEEDFRSG